MRYFIFLLVGLFLLPPVQAQQACTYRLTGHVHSSATHENLANATVTLVEKNKTLVTDSKGDFRFDSLCAGNYTIQITHTSFDADLKQVVLLRNYHVDVDLLPATATLNEVTITGVRPGAVTGIKKEISGAALEETRGNSFAEALARMNGVALLQTGANIAKPVIHGLHSNRILTINNGVRQEGQQWGNEHAPEIDPFIANKLTIVKGVEELRYGSDAIGGVILVEPKALRNTPGYNAELNAVYSTNNRQWVTSGIFEQQLKKLPSFTYRLQGTFKKGANVRAPHYSMNNTALEEKNFSLTAGWRREHFQSEIYYSLFNTQVGIFEGTHIGNLTDLLKAIEQYRPDPTFTGENTYAIGRPRQDVTHHLLKWKAGFDVGRSKFNLLVAGQNNRRLEFDVVRNSENKNPQLSLSINTLSQEINWEHPKKYNLNGSIGVVALQQNNSYSGRYLIPNYNSFSYGAYAIEKWTKGKWNVEGGIRFDNKVINTSRLQALSQVYTRYGFDFSTLAASFNGGYKILPQWKVSTTLSHATRAPHVNELLTNGIHHGSGTYEVGDIQLQPEQSLNLLVNSHYSSNNGVLAFDLTFYRNRINHFIYQQPKPDEPVLTIRGAFPKIAYQATDALLQGMDATLTLQPHKQLTYTGRYALLRAHNRRINDWLFGMPSDRIHNSLTYLLKDGNRFTGTYFSVELQNVLQQTRVPDERDSKQDYKLPPAGYALLNANASTQVTVDRLPLTIGVSGRNLLNQTYREYLNSFRYFADDMGRNISLRLKIELQHFY